MSKIIIRKRVTLEFLGEEYANSYLVFRSIPVRDYEEFTKKLPKPNARYVELVKLADANQIADDDAVELKQLQSQESENNLKYLGFILDFLKKYYLGGQFPNDDGELEAIDSDEGLGSLDTETVTRCFEVLTGTGSDPKAE